MRRTIQIATPAAAVLVATTLGACAPVLSHGPRVQEGTTVGVSGAVFSSADLSDGGNDEPIEAVIPYFTSAERHGDGTATQFTVALVIPSEDVFGRNDEPAGILHGVQMDYYRELASEDSSRAHGRGIHLSLSQLMPYAQWGIYSGPLGLYTTQGVGIIGPLLGLPPAAFFWSPGVGVEYDAEVFTVRAQLSGMAMVSTDGEFADAFTFGFTVQAGGRDRNRAETAAPSP